LPQPPQVIYLILPRGYGRNGKRRQRKLSGGWFVKFGL
jgi:hypothetical protein